MYRSQRNKVLEPSTGRRTGLHLVPNWVRTFGKKNKKHAAYDSQRKVSQHCCLTKDTKPLLFIGWQNDCTFKFFFFLQMKIETVKCHLLCLKVKSLFTFVVPRMTGIMALGWKVNYSWGSSWQRSGCFGQIDAAGWALCQNFCIWQTPFVTEPSFVSSTVAFSFFFFFFVIFCALFRFEKQNLSPGFHESKLKIKKKKKS